MRDSLVKQFPAPLEVDRQLYFIDAAHKRQSQSVSGPSRGRQVSIRDICLDDDQWANQFPSPLEVDRYLYK